MGKAGTDAFMVVLPKRVSCVVQRAIECRLRPLTCVVRRLGEIGEIWNPESGVGLDEGRGGGMRDPPCEAMPLWRLQ